MKNNKQLLILGAIAAVVLFVVNKKSTTDVIAPVASGDTATGDPNATTLIPANVPMLEQTIQPLELPIFSANQIDIYKKFARPV